MNQQEVAQFVHKLRSTFSDVEVCGCVHVYVSDLFVVCGVLCVCVSECACVRVCARAYVCVCVGIYARMCVCMELYNDKVYVCTYAEGGL